MATCSVQPTRKHSFKGLGCLHKRGNVWWLRVTSNGRTIDISLHTTERRVAESLRWQRHISNSSGDNAPISAPTNQVVVNLATPTEPPMGIGIRNVWEIYVANRSSMSLDTETRSKTQLDNFVEWLDLNHPCCQMVQQVNDSIAMDYFKSFELHTSPSTYNKRLDLFNKIWRTIGRTLGLTTAPWSVIERKKNTFKRHESFTEDELREVIRVAKNYDDEYYMLVLISSYTGLRLKDCVLTTFESIYSNGDDALMIVTPHKTQKSTNISIRIPLHPILLRELKKLYPSWGEGYLLPRIQKVYVKDASRITFRIQKHIIGKVITQTKCAIDGYKHQVAIHSFHSIRHSVATMLTNRFVADSIVQTLLGHSRMAQCVTARYQHISDETMREAIRKLPNLVDEKDEGKDKIEEQQDQRFANMDNSEIVDMVQRLLDELSRRRAG